MPDMTFGWDEKKQALNKRKHGPSFVKVRRYFLMGVKHEQGVRFFKGQKEPIRQASEEAGHDQARRRRHSNISKNSLQRPVSLTRP